IYHPKYGKGVVTSRRFDRTLGRIVDVNFQKGDHIELVSFMAGSIEELSPLTGPIVRIAKPLMRDFSSDKVEMMIEGDTIEKALDNLESKFPGIKERLLKDASDIKETVIIFRNGEDVRNIKGLDTLLTPGDEVTITPIIAGGSGEEEPNSRIPGTEKDASDVLKKRFLEAVRGRRELVKWLQDISLLQGVEIGEKMREHFRTEIRSAIKELKPEELEEARTLIHSLREEHTKKGEVVSKNLMLTEQLIEWAISEAQKGAMAPEAVEIKKAIPITPAVKGWLDVFEEADRLRLDVILRTGNLTTLKE
ncbi:MAG: hypothetical protein A3J72_06160, partial [Nitrospirae bacterium RIFCSPHIGHO2_02_FULL_40_19]